MKSILRERLANDFIYHPPHGNQTDRYAEIRAKLLETANFIVDRTPESREQSLALTKLEEAMFWANAAIARNEVPIIIKAPAKVDTFPTIEGIKS